MSTNDFAYLRIAAETLEDAMKARISMSNRIGRVTTKHGTDEEMFLGQVVSSMEGVEKYLERELKHLFKAASPDLYAFVLETPGLGEHTVARLLGVIGDPLNATPSHWEPNPNYDESKPKGRKNEKRILVDDDPFERTLRQLWAYCGYGDSTLKRVKGMSAEDAMALGNPRAKPLLYVMVENCVKMDGTPKVYTKGKLAGRTIVTQVSPYREAYDRAKAHYVDHVDADGEPWSKGHKDFAAYRIVAKEILRDLWLVRKGEAPRLGRSESDLMVAA